MTRAEINAYIDEYTGSDPDQDILLLDGLDDAFIGLTDDNNIRAVYSVNKIIECLSKDMTEEEAYEYYDYNIQCAYVGEKTPIYVKTL
jgi:radical SAM superfamily enzyme YgiQ (UPF0313 family)